MAPLSLYCYCVAREALRLVGFVCGLAWDVLVILVVANVCLYYGVCTWFTCSAVRTFLSRVELWRVVPCALRIGRS